MRFGQLITIGLRVPPKCDATCLVHWNGVSAAIAQPTGIFGSVSGPPMSSYLANVRQAELDAVQTRNAVDRAFQTAFGRGAIVADDVNDQRIVELAFRSNGADHASDLGVGIFEVG